MSLSSTLSSKATVTLIAILSFFAGSVLSPITEEYALEKWNEYVRPQKQIVANVCIPISSAFAVLRDHNGEPLASGPTKWPNRVSIEIRNETGRILKDLKLVALTAKPTSLDVDLLSASVITDSLAEASDYEFRVERDSIIGYIGQLNPHDTILMRYFFDGPVGIVLEFSSSTYSQKSTHLQGCEGTEYIEMTQPFSVMQYESENCKKEEGDNGGCEISLTPFEFEVKEEMAGKTIKVEYYFNGQETAVQAE